MKTYDSPIFVSVPKPDTFDELMRVIRGASAGDDEGVVRMWRGQSDISWRIDSAAYRRLARTKDVPADSDLRFYEKSLLEQATHRGFRYVNGRALGDLELLARLQHHGAATRDL